MARPGWGMMKMKGNYPGLLKKIHGFFVFTPSQSLAEKGVNVNIIRERLKSTGKLIQAAPKISEKGGISFEFIVETDENEETFKKWLADGLTFQRYTEPPEDSEEKEKKVNLTHASVATVQNTPSTGFVRVDLARLDDLMRMIGDLVVSRARLHERLILLDKMLPVSEIRPLQEINLAIERQLRELREGVMRVRLVPVREIFQRMKFVVRDISREMQKQVVLHIEGEETEIDKFVVERMMDPLLHIVRNAVSHGLEPEPQRLSAGKSVEGRIFLKASTAGNSVIISIKDDGGGIDIDKVMAKARKLDITDNDTTVDQAQLLNILCSPGFSTRDEADHTSGRGVGMTVVKDAISELGGSIKLETKKNQGTQFTIQLPLTLAIVDALIVKAGGQTFAVPQTSVTEVFEILPGHIKKLENNEIVPYRDNVLPLVRLSDIFSIKEMWKRSCYALVAGDGSDTAGVVVDHLIGQREIVVRAITEELIQVNGVVGATELGDGKAVLILDLSELVKMKKTAKKE